MSEITLRHASTRPDATADCIVFAASDGNGILEVCITNLFWEGLQSKCPLPCDADDRRDFAAQAVELLAQQREVSTASDGRRVVFVG